MPNGMIFGQAEKPAQEQIMLLKCIISLQGKSLENQDPAVVYMVVKLAMSYGYSNN